MSIHRISKVNVRKYTNKENNSIFRTFKVLSNYHRWVNSEHLELRNYKIYYIYHFMRKEDLIISLTSEHKGYMHIFNNTRRYYPIGGLIDDP